MKKNYLLVFSNPITGKEEAYNRWYTEIHVPEILKISGFVGAQRFKQSDTSFPVSEHKYMAIYEAPPGEMQNCIEKLFAASGSMQMEPVIDLENIKAVAFESITDLLKPA
jgi:hypothetical protein